MGFTGIVQTWNEKPQREKGWIEVNFYEEKGYLKLSSRPKNKFEWVLMLSAGPFFTLILALSGLFLFLKSKPVKLKATGIILSFINTVGFVFFPFTYFTSNGDTAFIAYHLGISKVFIELPYQLVKGVIFVFISYLLIKNRRKGWFTPLFLGGFFSLFPLFFLNSFVKKGVLKENAFFQPALGFSMPVFLLHLLIIISFIIYFRRLK